MKLIRPAAFLILLFLLLGSMPAIAEETGEQGTEGQENTGESGYVSEPGELNGDGMVTAADAAIVLRAAAGLVDLNTAQSYNADVTASMTVDGKDAVALLLYSAELLPDVQGAAGLLDGALLGERYADRFSYNGTVRTDSSYRSSMVNVTMKKERIDRSWCFVADIYIRDITAFQTAFGKDTFNGGRESTYRMAKNHEAIIAINGDSLSYQKAEGTLVRAGELYVEKVSQKDDTCVLYRDGRMMTFEPGATLEEMEAGGEIYHTWCFGPSLLDDEGNPRESFSSSRRIMGENPRTAIGYYEPGHYCFVLVDGRQSGYSTGMSMEALAAYMADLGCKVAYNLDGGQTSVMASADGVINQPYGNGRSTTDILYIAEPALVEASK